MRLEFDYVHNPRIVFDNTNERRFATKLLIASGEVPAGNINIETDRLIRLEGDYEREWLEWLSGKVHNSMRRRFLDVSKFLQALDILVKELRCLYGKEVDPEGTLNRILAEVDPDYIIPDRPDEDPDYEDQGYEALLNIAQTLIQAMKLY